MRFATARANIPATAANFRLRVDNSYSSFIRLTRRKIRALLLRAAFRGFQQTKDESSGRFYARSCR